MKMLKVFYVILICMMHIMHTMHAMHDENLSLSTAQKLPPTLFSLKQLCFNALIKQEPQKAKELFVKKLFREIYYMNWLIK